MKSQIFAGTSGWAYSTWKPDFYPAKLASRKFLEYYATRLNTVEVNYTFRSELTETQLQGWLAATPPGFRFSFKAPQTITHMRRLRDCDELLEAFLASLKPVVKAGKDGVLLFQFPPNFRAAALGKDKRPNQQALAAFLKKSEKRLRRAGWRIALEFRDAGWFTEETYALLRQHNAALCIAESEDLVTPDVPTADFYYARMRVPGYNESRFSLARSRFLKRAKVGSVFVYFKHEEAPDGALSAEKLLKRLPR